MKVSVIALQYPFSNRNYQWHGIAVYPLNGANKKYKQLFMGRKALHIAKLIHKEAFVDYIHSFWLHRSTSIGKYIANTLGVSFLATAMGQEMRLPKRSFKRLVKANFSIISLSQFQDQALRKQGVFPKEIIPWGLTKSRNVTKDNDLVCVGSLIPLKNVAYFISLCDRLKKSRIDFQAKIIGEGPEFDALRTEIEVCDLTSNVQLLGGLPYNETQEWIARSSLLVHTSTFEGFGMTIIEALSSGTHVISTPVGIAKELEIPHLIGDLELDVSMIQLLLRTPDPSPVLFEIQDTVKAYRAIYGCESMEKGIDS